MRQCKRSFDEITDRVLDNKWRETSLFCLAFKIKAKLFTDCFYQANYYRTQTIYIKYIIALTGYLYCYMHMLYLAEEKII